MTSLQTLFGSRMQLGGLSMQNFSAGQVSAMARKLHLPFATGAPVLSGLSFSIGVRKNGLFPECPKRDN